MTTRDDVARWRALADAATPCPDCDGSGHLGTARDGRLVSCERCGGYEDALGLGWIVPDRSDWHEAVPAMAAMLERAAVLVSRYADSDADDDTEAWLERDAAPELGARLVALAEQARSAVTLTVRDTGMSFVRWERVHREFPGDCPAAAVSALEAALREIDALLGTGRGNAAEAEAVAWLDEWRGDAPGGEA